MAGGGGGSGGSDTSLDFMWALGALVVIVIILWYFGKPYLTPGIFYIRLGELLAAKYTILGWNKIAAPIHLPTLNLALLNKWQEYIQNSPGVADFKTVKTLSIAVGNYIRFPICAGLLLIATYLSQSSEKYCTTYNMKLFRELEQEDWPQIAPVVKLDLGNTDLDKLPWAIALSPINFCRKYKLLQEEEKDGKIVANLIRGASYRVLSLQLGPQWRGVKALPPHVKALFALFISRVNDDKKTASKLIIQFAKSAAHGKLNMDGVDEIIQKYQGHKLVTKTINLHAYVTTVMASLLTEVRESGVLASSEFIWLKPRDRRLWYMLNCVGRTTPFAEISGAFAHWLAEKKLGLPLTIPMVEEAVKGLDASLKDTLYKPLED